MRERALMPDSPKKPTKRGEIRKIEVGGKGHGKYCGYYQKVIPHHTQLKGKADEQRYAAGPANMGMAKGEKLMSFFSMASCFTFLLMARPFEYSDLERNKSRPDLVMMMPPAMRNPSMLMPKKSRM